MESRRSFLRTTAAAAVVSQTVRGANDRIQMGIIGTGERGMQDFHAFSYHEDCVFIAACDVNKLKLEPALQVMGGKVDAYGDYRCILERKDIDAVLITTPDHWHSPMMVEACAAGKDVYVEKPVSHNISEGRRLVQVARKLDRICQAGTQNRSNGALAQAIKYIRDGRLGEVKLARSIVYGRRGSIGGPGSYQVPAIVDYNLWAGPAPTSPLTRPQFHYDWHWFWNTGNGELGNNNIHSLDICRWGLGLTGLGRAVLSYGGRLGYTDAAQTPNTQVVIYDFGGKTIVAETRGLKTEPFHPQFKSGWIFTGTEGIVADTSLFDLDGKWVRAFEGENQNHFANFLNAVRSRNVSALNADILEGHQSTALCHIGNISWRLGAATSAVAIQQQLSQLQVHDDVLETFERTRKHLAENNVDLEKTKLTLGRWLRLHPDQERFADDPAANALLTRAYRKPFVVPAETEV